MKPLLAAFLLFFTMLPAANSTTCAFDGHVLAADAQRTGGHAKHMGAKKIHYFAKYHCYVACAGNCDKIQEFLLWFETQDATKLVIGEFEAMACYENGDLMLYQETSKSPVPMDPPLTLGSGGDFAMGAMAAGKSATEAVAIAEDLDIYTGGKITSVVVVPDSNPPIAAKP